MERRSYKISPIFINGHYVEEVIIDPHVDKHKDHIDDDLILALVERLSEARTQISDYKDRFSYFVSLIDYEDRSYKMVWLIEDLKFYIGVITAFKDRRI